MAAPILHVASQSPDSGSEGDLDESDENDETYAAELDEGPTENHDLTPTGEGESQKEKHGLADVMAKILHKNVPVHKQVILAKGQTDREIRKRKLAAEKKEDEEEGKKEKQENTEPSTDAAVQEKKKLWENMCRVKPDILKREKERQLQRIATRGVVQLFNAVRKQQKTVQEEVQKTRSDRKREKVMETITKDKFLNMLKGTSVSNVHVEEESVKEKKSDDRQVDQDKEREKKWSILHDDYMMGAKMKDWNKESSDDDEENGPDDEMSDSD